MLTRRNRTKLTRRNFVGLPAVELIPLPAAAAFAQVPNGPAAGTICQPTGSLEVWVTDKKRRLAAAPSIMWGAAADNPSSSSIVIRPERKAQEILGFGAAFTDAACYLFHQLPSEARDRLFHTLFARSEMNLNVCRICIGSSDCSTAVFSYDDGNVDPDLRRFSIARDHEYVLPILRQVRSVNPELFLFASPWSPPGWMKSNGSMLGGCMRHTYMPSYADYFLKFLRAYEAAGVPVQAVTVQNEVDADQDGTMPACAWPQDYEADFVTMHLGPLFQRAGISTKIWIIDHNYNLWGRAIAELETPDVRRYTNAIAWHGYAGEPEWIHRVQDAFPDTEMHWTEGGPNYLAPDYLTNWTRWGETFCRILRSCCRSITAWSLISDEHGRPYVGSGASGVGGTMLIHSNTQEISYSGMFWALGHFSRFVRMRAKRIDSQSVNNNLQHCAFQNSDGAYVVVISNPGLEQSCQIRLADGTAEVVLTEDSLTTLVCKNAVQG
jgi:glucosylceramidase